jgi:hypothetical protein
MLRDAGIFTFALVQLYSVPHHVGIGQCYRKRLSAFLALWDKGYAGFRKRTSKNLPSRHFGE